jgi:hypothetical protein
MIKAPEHDASGLFCGYLSLLSNLFESGLYPNLKLALEPECKSAHDL